MPYDADAPLEEQVRQSVAASLRNLRTTYVDCLVLHSPLPSHGETMRAWRAMERHVQSGEARALGVSNIYDPGALAKLHEEAEIKPSVVQNRFYPDTRHDGEVRQFCRSKGMAYQSFWTLTGNKRIVDFFREMGERGASSKPAFAAEFKDTRFRCRHHTALQHSSFTTRAHRTLRCRRLRRADQARVCRGHARPGFHLCDRRTNRQDLAASR